jgi:integrase
MQRLQWSDVDLGEKIVRLRTAITKKGRSRHQILSENAVTWIEAYRQMGGRMEGPVVGYTPSLLEGHCKANHRRSGVRGIKNGGRHSYCSYSLAWYGDINSLCLQSGHRTTDTLWKHYYRAATKADAERYWDVRPKAAATNVVRVSN